MTHNNNKLSTRPAGRPLAARYDAAATTEDNRRLWENASGYSANALLSPDVRAKIRNRCRYETRNNTYAKGIGQTIANDTIGTGPQVQVMLADKEAATFIETEFYRWTVAIGLPRKLWLMRFARWESGELFAIRVTNPRLRHRVKLDVQLRESEECASSSWSDLSELNDADGIEFDTYGNPRRYWFLDRHPGATAFTGLGTEGRWVNAASVFHYFHPERPGQARGVPDMLPALPNFGELRRYSNAVIRAAETAADFAAVLSSDAPADEDAAASTEGPEATEFRALDAVPLERGLATIIPKGYALGQIKAEQPVTTYPDYFNTKLKEIARCVSVPFTIASLDSSVSNMSSAYVDRQVYIQNRIIDRAGLELFIEELFQAWLEEARLLPEYLPATVDDIPHQYYWPSLGHHADPLKVANAAMMDLKCGRTTLPKLHAANGDDWEEQQEAGAKSFGITVDEFRKHLLLSIFGAPPAPLPAEDPADAPA